MTHQSSLSNLTEDHKVILMLCSDLNDENANRPKPLSLIEYHQVVQSLLKSNQSPQHLLEKDVLIEVSNSTQIDQSRLMRLLARGFKLSLTLEKWESAGIWVLTRSDQTYPARYKRHLKEKSPPLLYGIGNQSLLNQFSTLGIFIANDLDEESKHFICHIAQRCAQNRLVIIASTNGIDQIAMRATLEAGGACVAVVYDHLLQKSLERQYLAYLYDGRLTLISPHQPNFKYQPDLDTERHSFTAPLSDYALVVHSQSQRGETWQDTVDRLKKTHQPVFVRMKDSSDDNQKLIKEHGALVWPETTDPIVFKEQLNQIINTANAVK
jgi:predicted Rossmann fold nucleotide-binding protein DprA/Smf involved in DNA uptake